MYWPLDPGSSIQVDEWARGLLIKIHHFSLTQINSNRNQWDCDKCHGQVSGGLLMVLLILSAVGLSPNMQVANSKYAKVFVLR